MNKIDELKWVRILMPDLIPRYLVEQVKKRDYTVDEFYDYQRLICLRDTPEGALPNPLSHLWVLCDKENLIKGFLWFTIDSFCKSLVLQTYTVDKEYWTKGESIKKLADHLKEIQAKANLKKIYWITDYPKHSQKHGFKISKSVLMEYVETTNEKSDNNGD
jgi:hypothetical protein